MSAALVLGGVDVTGPHLYNIYPHGSSDKLPYLTMGSGSLAAMSVSYCTRLLAELIWRVEGGGEVAFWRLRVAEPSP